MKPMLCQKFTPDEAAEAFAAGGWIVQQKFDGIRAVIRGGKLYDRREKDITAQFPEFAGLARLANIGVTIDGEIIAQTGEFNDISGRVHLRDKLFISIAARNSPAQFVAFDLALQGMTTKDRLERLQTMAGVLPSWCIVADTFKDFKEAWAIVEEKGWEGLVLKRASSFYVEGVRSPDWRKAKSFIETTATFVKFETTPRGITIETIDGRRVVVNGAQANDVKRRIESEGRVQAEIQFLPQKGSDAWRFPSFRGILT